MTRQPLHDELLKRLKEKRRFLQMLASPRQAGKTTLARQVSQASKLPMHQLRHQYRTGVLAGTESGSGFCSPPRQNHRGHRSEKRTPS
jgi:stage III sporulation protein SpoIIIAA